MSLLSKAGRMFHGTILCFQAQKPKSHCEESSFKTCQCLKYLPPLVVFLHLFLGANVTLFLLLLSLQINHLGSCQCSRKQTVVMCLSLTPAIYRMLVVVTHLDSTLKTTQRKRDPCFVSFRLRLLDHLKKQNHSKVFCSKIIVICIHYNAVILYTVLF